MTQTNEIHLTVSRVIDAQAERVFNAWLNPEMLARFMLPGEDMSVPKAESDAVENGRFLIVMAAGDKYMPHSGTYKTITPHSRIVFTWESPFATDESIVTLNFRPLEDKTEVVLYHTKFFDEQSRDDHQAGWSTILKHLGQIFS